MSSKVPVLPSSTLLKDNLDTLALVSEDLKAAQSKIKSLEREIVRTEFF